MPLTDPRGTPLTDAEFDALMRPLAPCGAAPRLAVAVSGGADSMALLLLAACWVARRGGTVTGLTVDHGLRAGAADEAAQVAAWCRAHGIPHRTLAWRGAKPDTGIQAAARAARYELLTGWCRAHGHRDLLVAHHQSDQAETFLYRLGRGSGPDGLAAMPAVTRRDGVRLVRPLLTVPPGRLRAFLAERGQTWLEDPTNQDRRFARVALRDRLAGLERAGIGPAAIAGAARVLGRLRAENDRRVAAAAAAAVTLHPAGFAEIDGAAFADADAAVARRLMTRLVGTVGGGVYPVRRDRLDRAFAAVRRGRPERARTLGGCLIAPTRRGFRLCREPGGVTEVVDIAGAARRRWDNRFDIETERRARGPAGRLQIRKLGEAGWQAIAAEAGDAGAIPGPARFALPALWRDGRVEEVPHIAYRRDPDAEKLVKTAEFRGDAAFSMSPFWVA